MSVKFFGSYSVGWEGGFQSAECVRKVFLDLADDTDHHFLSTCSVRADAGGERYLFCSSFHPLRRMPFSHGETEAQGNEPVRDHRAGERQDWNLNLVV